jgi:hypothetical protein
MAVHVHMSYAGWTIDPLVAAVQRHTLTTSTSTTRWRGGVLNPFLLNKRYSSALRRLNIYKFERTYFGAQYWVTSLELALYPLSIPVTTSVAERTHSSWFSLDEKTYKMTHRSYTRNVRSWLYETVQRMKCRPTPGIASQRGVAMTWWYCPRNWKLTRPIIYGDNKICCYRQSPDHEAW